MSRKNREIWRTLSGYEPSYQMKVSNRGRITIVPEVKRDDDGRLFVTLAGRDIPVDLLVAQAFIPNPTESEVPVHIDGDMTNNDADNIRWLPNGKDEDVPQRIYSTLALLKYVLHPNQLADRDKEFTKFYTYLDYLWKTGQLPVEEEQIILDGYDLHKKRATEDWISRNLKTNQSIKESNNANADIQKPTDFKQPELTRIESPNPFRYLPKEVLAEAIIDMYDRAVSQVEYQHASVPVVSKTGLTELIHDAIQRVVNQSPNKTYVDVFGKDKVGIDIYTKESKTEMSNFLNEPMEMALWATDTERRLNMVSPLPPLDTGKVRRTKHIQSLIYETLKNCHLPEWAQKEILSDISPEMLKKFKSLFDKVGITENPLLTSPLFNQSQNSDNKTTTPDFNDRFSKEKPNVDIMEDIQSQSVDKNEKSNNLDSSAFEKNQSQETTSSDKLSKLKLSFGGSSNKDSNDKSSESSKPKESIVKKNNLTFDDMYADAVVTTSIKKTSSSISDEFNDMVINKHIPVSTTNISFTNNDNDIKNSGDSGLSGQAAKPLPANNTDNKEYSEISSVNIPQERTPYSGSGSVSKDIELDAPYYRYKRDEAGFPIHYARQHIFSEDEKNIYKLPADINTTPEYDELGRPLYDEHYNPVVYDESVPVPVNNVVHKGPQTPERWLLGYQDKKKQAKKLAEYMTRNAGTNHPDYRKDIASSDPDYVSPLYVKERDLTLGYINAFAGREASAFYNRQGYKVYHNVPYGERFDPEVHTLFIPELFEFPPLFNMKNRKRSYLTEYAHYLIKRHPEITDPDIFRKYYETAKAARQLTESIPNCAKEVMWRHNTKSIPVRGWMSDGECLVFDSIAEASRATGCLKESIKDCCEGKSIQAYGIRWEYVDLCDMDTMINRYINNVMKVCRETEVDINWDDYLSQEARERMKDVLKPDSIKERQAFREIDKKKAEYKEYKEYLEKEKEKEKNLKKGKFMTRVDSVAGSDKDGWFSTSTFTSTENEDIVSSVNNVSVISDKPDKDKVVTGIIGCESGPSGQVSEGNIQEEVIEEDGREYILYIGDNEPVHCKSSSDMKDYVPYFKKERPDDFVFEPYDQSDKPWLNGKPLYECTDEWATECLEPVWDETAFDMEIRYSELAEEEKKEYMKNSIREIKTKNIEESAKFKEMEKRVNSFLDGFLTDNEDISTDEIIDDEILSDDYIPAEKKKKKTGRPKTREHKPSVKKSNIPEEESL